MFACRGGQTPKKSELKQGWVVRYFSNQTLMQGKIFFSLLWSVWIFQLQAKYSTFMVAC